MSLAATRKILFGSAAPAALAKAIAAIVEIHRLPCAPAFMLTPRFGSAPVSFRRAAIMHYAVSPTGSVSTDGSAIMGPLNRRRTPRRLDEKNHHLLRCDGGDADLGGDGTGADQDRRHRVGDRTRGVARHSGEEYRRDVPQDHRRKERRIYRPRRRQ